MREMSTISVPDQLQSELDEFAQEQGIAPNDLVRDAIEEYIFFRRMRLLRARMAVEAQAQGLFTDEDVFKRIS
jgi:predicted transcriptional regulator